MVNLTPMYNMSHIVYHYSDQNKNVVFYVNTHNIIKNVPYIVLKKLLFEMFE